MFEFDGFVETKSYFIYFRLELLEEEASTLRSSFARLQGDCKYKEDKIKACSSRLQELEEENASLGAVCDMMWPPSVYCIYVCMYPDTYYSTFLRTHRSAA